MKPKLELQMGKDMFTINDVLRMAAAYKGMRIPDGTTTCVYSDPLKSYVLNPQLLKFLNDRGIRQRPRPDCSHNTFTLVDENPQELDPDIALNNYWNFFAQKEGGQKFNLTIDLVVGFGFSEEEKGVLLFVRTQGANVCPCDNLPNYRMFKALVDWDEPICPVAKELVAGNGQLFINWAELGLTGIKSLADLFKKFAKGNEAVISLAKHQKVFDPNPMPQDQQWIDKLYVAEPAHTAILEAWAEQLKRFRDLLV